MQDKSGAHPVAPDGSRLGIMPATSGGVATQPRAPGQERPPGAPSGVPRPDRPRATPQAPDQDVPWAMPAQAPGSDRSSALFATAAAPDSPHVLHPAPGPDSSHRGPATGPPPTSVTHPTTLAHDLYGRTYTAEEVQQLTQADDAPLLAAEVRLLQVLIQRVVAPGYPSARRQHHRRRGAAVRRRQRAKRLDTLATVGRALDVLRRLLKDRQALAPESESALFQLLDEAAKYMDDPPPPADALDEKGAPPSDMPTFKPPEDLCRSVITPRPPA